MSFCRPIVFFFNKKNTLYFSNTSSTQTNRRCNGSNDRHSIMLGIHLLLIEARSVPRLWQRNEAIACGVSPIHGSARASCSQK